MYALRFIFDKVCPEILEGKLQLLKIPTTNYVNHDKKLTDNIFRVKTTS